MNVKGVTDGNGDRKRNWVVKEVDMDDYVCDSSVSIGSISEDSMHSVCSISSSELADQEASSSSISSSSSSHSNGPLYELSDLMNHLPLKRGLSMFYEGKAQSFSSLAIVQSIEDLPKKERPYRNKIMKSCKSYGGGLELDSHKISYSPKATISKKSSKGTFSSVVTKKGKLLGGYRPSFAVQKNF